MSTTPTHPLGGGGQGVGKGSERQMMIMMLYYTRIKINLRWLGPGCDMQC